jgi:hypothetical protein
MSRCDDLKRWNFPGSAAHPCLRASGNSRLTEAGRQGWAALPGNF